VQEAMHQSDKRLLQSHIDSLEATNEDQSKTIRSLSETINTFEARLSATTQKLEKSTRNNKIIMSKLSEYEEALYATKDEMLNIEREKERIKCWIDLHKRSVEDYEQCLKKLGIFDINASISLGLSSHLQNVLSENKDMKANLQIAEHEMRQVKKETNEIMSKYVQEIAKLRSDLLSAKMDQEHALGRAEKSERERDEAIHLASKTSAECKHLREQITKIEISNEEIMADLAIKSKNQLKSVRDQFEMERDGLRQQIELLHGSKVQLQV
jgi:chromosome segregation ATPase